MRLFQVFFDLLRTPSTTCANGPEWVGSLSVCVKAHSAPQAIPRAEARAVSLLAENIELRLSHAAVLPGTVEEAERRLFSPGG